MAAGAHREARVTVWTTVPVTVEEAHCVEMVEVSVNTARAVLVLVTVTVVRAWLVVVK